MCTYVVGKGVDVILDCVGASYWERNMSVLARDGRWALYGLMGGSAINGNLFQQLLAKRARIEASTLRSRSNQVMIGDV